MAEYFSCFISISPLSNFLHFVFIWDPIIIATYNIIEILFCSAFYPIYSNSTLRFHMKGLVDVSFQLLLQILTSIQNFRIISFLFIKVPNEIEYLYYENSIQFGLCTIVDWHSYRNFAGNKMASAENAISNFRYVKSNSGLLFSTKYQNQ